MRYAPGTGRCRSTQTPRSGPHREGTYGDPPTPRMRRFFTHADGSTRFGRPGFSSAGAAPKGDGDTPVAARPSDHANKESYMYRVEYNRAGCQFLAPLDRENVTAWRRTAVIPDDEVAGLYWTKGGAVRFAKRCKRQGERAAARRCAETRVVAVV